MHHENYEEPNHETCQTPQELRWPEFRTAKHYPEIEKVFTTKRVTSYPSIKENKFYTELAVSFIWGEMTDKKAEILLAGIMKFDELEVLSGD